MIVEGYGTEVIKEEVEKTLVMMNKNQRYQMVVRYDKNYLPISFSVRKATKKEMN